MEPHAQSSHRNQNILRNWQGRTSLPTSRLNTPRRSGHRSLHSQMLNRVLSRRYYMEELILLLITKKKKSNRLWSSKESLSTRTPINNLKLSSRKNKSRSLDCLTPKNSQLWCCKQSQRKRRSVPSNQKFQSRRRNLHPRYLRRMLARLSSSLMERYLLRTVMRIIRYQLSWKSLLTPRKILT